jgi:hypothetical protein
MKEICLEDWRDSTWYESWSRTWQTSPFHQEVSYVNHYDINGNDGPAWLSHFPSAYLVSPFMPTFSERERGGSFEPVVVDMNRADDRFFCANRANSKKTTGSDAVSSGTLVAP